MLVEIVAAGKASLAWIRILLAVSESPTSTETMTNTRLESFLSADTCSRIPEWRIPCCASTSASNLADPDSPALITRTMNFRATASAASDILTSVLAGWLVVWFGWRRKKNGRAKKNLMRRGKERERKKKKRSRWKKTEKKNAERADTAAFEKTPHSIFRPRFFFHPPHPFYLFVWLKCRAKKPRSRKTPNAKKSKQKQTRTFFYGSSSRALLTPILIDDDDDSFSAAIKSKRSMRRLVTWFFKSV